MKCWEPFPDTTETKCLKCGLEFNIEDPRSYYSYPIKWHDLIELHLVFFLLLAIPGLLSFPVIFAPILFIICQIWAFPKSLRSKHEKKYFWTHVIVNQTLLLTVLITSYLLD